MNGTMREATRPMRFMPPMMTRPTSAARISPRSQLYSANVGDTVDRISIV